MSAPTLKHYDDADIDVKELVNTHFSHGKIRIIEENMGFPIRVIHELVSTGQLKGEKALDASFGSIIYQLFPMSNAFKEIYVVQMTDASFKHFKQWQEKDQEATDWSFASKRACHLDGNRQNWKEKEEQVRKIIKGVYKWDDYEISDLDPKLVPQVDSVISVWLLNVISKTKDDLVQNIEKLTSRLRTGGHLLLFMTLDMTFYRVSNQSYFALTLDEKDVQEAMIKAGFIIEMSYLLKAVEDNDIVDYKHLSGVLARKIKRA